MNRAVTDCAKLLTKEVSQVRTMLTVVRNCAPMRLEFKFKKIQVRLGITDSNIVPNLDVETRWTSLFLMIDACYEAKKCISSALKHGEISGKTLRQTHYSRLEKVKSREGVLPPHSAARLHSMFMDDACNCMRAPRANEGPGAYESACAPTRRSQDVFLSHVAPPGALRAHRVRFLLSFIFSLRWDFCNFR
jgi:hypothetical protein